MTIKALARWRCAYAASLWSAAEGVGCATARALYATRPFTPEGVFLAVSLAVCYCGARVTTSRARSPPLTLSPHPNHSELQT